MACSSKNPDLNMRTNVVLKLASWWKEWWRLRVLNAPEERELADGGCVGTGVVLVEWLVLMSLQVAWRER